MTLQIHPPAQEVIARIKEAIEALLPDAQVEVGGAAGHFEIRVVSRAFEGLNRVKQQQLVYGAITPLMSGDAPPVHAVDRLETMVPQD